MPPESVGDKSLGVSTYPECLNDDTFLEAESVRIEFFHTTNLIRLICCVKFLNSGCFTRLTANVGVSAVAGLGGLVKGDSPTSPTSCKVFTVTNVYNETECLMQLRIRPLHKHFVGGCVAFSSLHS